MQVYKQKELENVLNGMTSILMNNHPKKNKIPDEVREFLQCAYSLFSSWNGKLIPLLTGTYDADKFWPVFVDFLNECENGSWSQMARRKSEIEKYKTQLFSSIEQLLSTRADLDKTVGIMESVTENSSPKKIAGVTPFILSGILFASDEDNFMILDNPVLEYFDLKDYREALSEYRNIIDISRSYSKKFKLSIWYINKAYGILSHDGELAVKKFCGNCRSMKSKNFVYSFG